MKKDDLLEFATGIRHNMFGVADDVYEAVKYAYDLIDTLTPEQKVGAFTALHVLLNTVAQELERIAQADEEDSNENE